MELEERVCVCGKIFRCLPTSSQKYHGIECRPPEPRIGGYHPWGVGKTKKSGKNSTQSEKKKSDSVVKGTQPMPNNYENNLESMAENTDVDSLLNKGEESMMKELESGAPSELESIDSEKILERSEDDILDELEIGERSGTRTIMPAIERRSSIGVIKDVHTKRSEAYSERLQQVSSQSQSLVDESIGQLKELMKLSVASLYSQDAKTRDPQMINAAVNSAKAITNLLRIKLEAAKLK